MSAHYFNPQEMINKTIIFDERPAASVASSFHVAYGIDKNFLFDGNILRYMHRLILYLTLCPFHPSFHKFRGKDSGISYINYIFSFLTCLSMVQSFVAI